MARRRTVDLLPEIFRTSTNRQFLAATLDQVTQEPQVKRTQGWIGRRIGPGVVPTDNYVTEPTAQRANYQLEPGVVFLKPDTNTVDDAVPYPGIIDALNVRGANTARQDRLFQSEYYAFDPFCDLDKFVNYSQYYWLPQGPDSVDVSKTLVPLTDDFEVTRGNTAYTFEQVAGENPIITLVRGGNYRFSVNQPGHGFWIQAAPGTSGTLPQSPNISSRDVLGVANNGADGGDVIFNVPLLTAQDFYYGLNSIGNVDLVTNLKFNQINNVYVDEFLSQYTNGIDGITDLDGRSVVFVNDITDAEEGGWQITTQFDPLANQGNVISGIGSYDSTTFDQTTDITEQSQRYSIWRITYVYDDSSRPFMQLTTLRGIPELNKFRVLFGSQWSNTQWYKDASGFLQKIPLLTAAESVLWYQDSTNPELFGQIKLINADQTQPLDIDEIIGAKTYISPNGIRFTNGLKIQFRGLVEPAQFQNLEFYVEGVGTGPGLDARVGFIDGEAYFGPWHWQGTQKVTGARRDTSVFQQYIYDSVADSLINRNAGGPAGAPLPNIGQPGAAQGNGIRLIPVTEMVTPETYTQSETIPYDVTAYDSDPYDAGLNAPEIPDYLTINRASRDRNAWSRSNRWFNVDVIRYAAQINNILPVIDNAARGRRPIIEFRADMKLWQSGSLAKNPVDVIDFQETDALSNINGQPVSAVDLIDGYQLQQNTRVIFAADIDPQVRNKIYIVDLIDPDGVTATAPVINLVPALDNEALVDDMVVCLTGLTLQGKSFYFNGLSWVLAQEKTSVNQAPLFDVYDSQGRSFGDTGIYSASTFRGSRLFGYAIADSTIKDPVLGLALKYQTLNNVGDIVFNNYFFNDTFVYVRDSISQETAISTGFARQYITRTLFSDLLGWLTAAQENRSHQTFRFVYNDTPLIFDVPMTLDTVFNPLQLFVEGQYIDPGRYAITVSGLNTTVTFSDPPPTGSVIEAEIISDLASTVGFYQVPLNLECNPLNENSDSFTLGSLRNHYESIGQNLRNIQGPINGANNTRDLGNILVYGSDIVQHSSPMALGGVFLRQSLYELFDSLRFNSQEYEKYKARLIDVASRGDFINNTPTQILDAAIQDISLGRSNDSPFYWSDMIPSGETYQETIYKISPISTPTFDVNRVYDFSSSNFQSLLVYLNGNILTREYDYSVGSDSATITVSVTLTPGDTVLIREYASTFGSFVPNTPTKMGLYPAFRPEMYLDTSAVNPVMVIRGHDGSITRAYGDVRDQILLEFETRIFNNLKVTGDVPLTQYDVIPGQFRETDYDLAEINQILAPDFLSYVGWNKLDYVTQQYVGTNEFTYNYSQSGDKLTNQPLLGAWRGIYWNFFDTTAPNTRPWESLGFSQQPSWWEDYYGPAPYTSGNLVLWEDLAQGLVRDPNGVYIKPKFARPGLTQVIPAGSEGQLLSPLQCTVGRYDIVSFRRSWTFGDGGPVEASWRSSSSWPFAVMRLLALTKPAQFFSLFADRDRYKYDAGLEQYLWDQRYRLDAKNLAPLYGDGVSKASYINWIIDYNRQLGKNSTEDLEEDLGNLDIRLCWRVAGYSDKRFLKVRAERSTPDGQNTGLLLPDESYQILLYKNVPFDVFTYSAVIIQSTDDGWAVLGYNLAQPYFNILVSRPNGVATTLTAGGSTVRVPIEYTDRVARVPYGYVFTSRNAVCDFLMSYGELLIRQGWQFEGQENGYIMDWRQMAQEFLYWSNQGWITGSLINLNPGATKVSITRPGAVADGLQPYNPSDIIVNQNRQPMPLSNLDIQRLDNTFTVSSLTSDTVSFVSLRFTAYENLLVFDNRSIFADLLYQPSTGARQSRLLISGTISADWNGQVDAPGFVINQDSILEWQSNAKYTKGDIVRFKDQYWAAVTIVQPSEDFDYSQWAATDYDEIQQGLLLNAAGSSDQLSNAYSVYNANLEEEVDLFSYGLIGFRPREYMAALNLDDISQVNLYQQFLKTKGTRQALELFSLADLGKEVAEYDVYENWAMLRSVYGANANRSYFELLLNEALLSSDPSTIQVILPTEASPANQTVLLQNIWKQSYKLTSPNILPTLQQSNLDTSLPSAGYVNVDDVDISVFSLENRDAIAAQLPDIGVGTTIWVANVNAHEWNVYQVKSVPAVITSVCDNLDARSLVNFSEQHGLSVGDTLIIKYFNVLIDGVYVVRSVPNLQTVLIDYLFTGDQTEISGSGLAFTLTPSRVASPSDVASLPFAQRLNTGIKVWIDNNGNDQWQVLEKQNPFEQYSALTWETQSPNSGYGTTVAQGFDNLTALIGAPYENGTGAVYSWVKQADNSYVQNIKLVLPVTATSEYGSAIDIGNQSWALIGAPGSNSGTGYAAVIVTEPGSNALDNRQILTAGADYSLITGFGSAVTISQDERWAFVAAPEDRRVYAWSRIDVETQSVSYITDGSSTEFQWSNQIIANAARPGQLVVVLDNSVIPAYDPSLVNQGTTFRPVPGNVDFIEFLDSTGSPYDLPVGVELNISRRISAQLDNNLYLDVQQSSVVPAGPGIGSGAMFTVNVQRGVYTATVARGGVDYNYNDQITIDGSEIGGGSNLVFDVTQTGNIYTTVGEAISGSDVIYVNSAAGLSVTQTLFKVPGSGSGTLPGGVQITDINVNQLTAQQVVEQTADYSVVARSTADIPNIAISAPLFVDQLRVIAGDRILVLNQSNLSNNGIYEVVTPGTGSNGTWTKIFGTNDLADKVVQVIGPVPPRQSIAPQLYVGTQWLMIRINQLTLSAAATATGTLSFFASPGPITQITYVSGSGLGNTDEFNLTSLFATVNNIYSFKITVGDQIQRPFVDYTFDSITGNVTFESGSNPAAGSSIYVESRSHFETRAEFLIDDEIIPVVDSALPGSQFGFSISTTTDGRQLIVGCPQADVTVSDGNLTSQLNSAGSAYVFDRSVEKFIVYDDSSSTFVTQRTLIEPVAVKVNGSFLANNNLNLNGGFTVTGANTVTITAALSVGDVVEIETNHWQFLQQIEATTPFELARFGYRVDQCVNDCSLYVGAPFDSTDVIESGSVEYWNNQARVYGTVTSNVDNPVLTPGDTIRINGFYVELSDPRDWNLGPVVGDVWPAGTFVQDSGNIYQARIATPESEPLTNDDYWRSALWLDVLAADITSSVPNVLATVMDQRLTVSVKNFDATVPLNRLSVLPGTGSLFDDIGIDIYIWQQRLTSPIQQTFAHFGKSIFISDNTTTLVVGAPDGDMIRPETFDDNTTTFDAGSTAFADVEQQSGAVYTFDFLASSTPSMDDPGQFVFGQQLIDKSVGYLDQFGSSLDYTTGTLLIGTPGFDSTTADDNVGNVLQWINANQTPAWSVLRQQTPVVDVNLLNTVFMYDIAEGQVKQYFDFFDPLQGRLLGPVAQNIDYIGTVDPAAYNVGIINNYGKRWGQERVGQIWWDTTRVRFLDPNQGDITYASRRWGQLFPGSLVQIYQWTVSPVPPSQYTGPGIPLSVDSYSTVGEVNQEGIFVVNYYFWVTNVREINRTARKTLSIETLARYIENPRGSGLPYIAPVSASAVAIYNALPYISAQDTVLHIEFDRQLTSDAVHVEYQIIPQGRADGFLDDGLYRKFVDSLAGSDSDGRAVPDPTLPPSELYGVDYRPRQSMFANRFLALENYLTRANEILAQIPAAENRIFNLLNSREPEPTSAAFYLAVDSTVPGNGTDTISVVVSLDLILQGRMRVAVNGILYSLVPDDSAFVAQSYYLAQGSSTSITDIVFDSVISDSDSVTIEIFVSEWNKEVANIEELSYQDLASVPQGYRYLVDSDSNNNGLWTIYEKQGSELRLVRVQNYDTRRYWNYRDWYQPGYNPLTRIALTVPNTAALETITVPTGTSVKVAANAQGQWEIYLREATTWRRVALQNGTIEFLETLWNYSAGRYGFDVEVFDAQYYDEEPGIETRKIIESINQEIMIGDLLLQRNNLLTLMFNFILTEQIAPKWLTKTSLIDVDHTIRELVPFQIYRTDNQDFVLQYINEVKPYHVQIREFNLIYRGNDVFQGSLTDFDLPAYWNEEENLFVSPILDDTGRISTTSSVPSTSPVWQTFPWNQWYQNYLLSIEAVSVVSGGTGYTVAPEVVVTGDCERPAVMAAKINSAGQVTAIEVIDPGFGYLTTAIIAITGGNGSGAVASAVMGNSLVRNIHTTIKYDRVSYASDIVDWQPNVIYTTGTRVRFADRVWSANLNVQNSEFDISQWTLVPASQLNAADRVQGYYAPSADMPGRDLALVMTGIDYPGVQVRANDFDQNIPLDVIYESSFTDIYLGTLATDINVDGGAFVDTYESHAPEELVPGRIFDTMDFRVYSTPGSDWTLDGHGFPISVVGFEYQALPFYYGDASLYPAVLIITNETRGLRLYQDQNYTVDWVSQTITVTSGAALGDRIVVEVYEIGGGNQLYRELWLGEPNLDSVVVPVPDSIIESVAVFVNGTSVQGSLISRESGSASRITFPNSYGITDSVLVTILGFSDNGEVYSWSTPVVENFVSNGSMNYTIADSLSGTNPANIIVERNGVRLRPAEGVQYISDGTTLIYDLPSRGNYLPSQVSDNDVAVYVNNQPLALNVDFVVDPWDGSSTVRTVTLADAPTEGLVILISVRTASPYYLSGDQLIFKSGGGVIPQPGDIISVTTWNDTQQQDLLTQVFVGPTDTVIGIPGAVEGYDDTVFDAATISDTPGSFDYSTGLVVKSNRFNIGREILNANRLMVSVNGLYIFENQGYTVEGSQVIISGPVISNGTVVTITSMTQSVLPGEAVFRIFQDMLGIQRAYRITPQTTTKLAQPLSAAGDVVFVENASHLSEPNLQQGIFGQITINGERITYRARDIVNNTVSGLRRGTAGTGAANHGTGSEVYDIGVGNLLPERYQNQLKSNYFVSDGISQVYTADDVEFDAVITVNKGGQISVTVDGQLLQQDQFSISSYEPVSVTLSQVPPRNSNVTVTVTQVTAAIQSQSFTASGFTSGFGTNIDMIFLPVNSVDFTVANLSPLTITLAGIPLSDTVFQVESSGASPQDSELYFLTDGNSNQLIFDVDFARPIIVKIGGEVIPETSYQVNALSPVSVTLDQAPESGIGIEISITQALTWYQAGIDSASDGVPLQETNTQAARFIRGEL